MITVLDNNPGYRYAPLWSNDFTNPAWQWNHIPDKAAFKVEPCRYQIQTDKTVVNITQAANTYTQRTLGEQCAASVTLDASCINEGDFAGLAALEGEYGFIAVTRRSGKLYLVTAEHKISYTPWSMGVFDTDPPDIKAELPLENAALELGLEFDLTKPVQQVRLMYRTGDGDAEKSRFVQLGESVQLRYTLDQFVGVRFALFCYSTQKAGGRAVFTDFNYLSSSNRL
jgi:beta-xylosidase